jgi:hypothetical protein
MASGHVNRIKRPNTWLHRPMLQNREESSCQTGAVHTWPLDDLVISSDVRFAPILLQKSAVTDGCRSAISLRATGFDPPALTHPAQLLRYAIHKT